MLRVPRRVGEDRHRLHLPHPQHLFQRSRRPRHPQFPRRLTDHLVAQVRHADQLALRMVVDNPRKRPPETETNHRHS